MSRNGTDKRKRIIGAKAPTPFLFNLDPEYVERFRKQIAVIDLVNEGSPEILRQAIWSCYQERPTPFREYELWDIGACGGPPLSGKITWRVTHPEKEPKNEEEQAQVEKLQKMMKRIREAMENKKRKDRNNT